jgi:hypothetical protein
MAVSTANKRFFIQYLGQNQLEKTDNCEKLLNS